MPRRRRRREDVVEMRNPVLADHPEETVLQVTARLGLEDLEYRVRELSADGFAISPLRPLAPGSVVHVSFQLPAGLSISVRAVARRWHGSSGRQWFEFTDVDREVINLLLLATESTGVH
ncbi:MAG: PilZ domain-containing protein [Acidobacteriota bacterium]|jgi:hypothetical protein|nr:MAG: hypothetical protein DIU54_10320 [Acidobacteriota bacterium]